INGLSVSDFMKRITVQRATADGLMGLAKTATTLANAEGLTAHALAVSIRRDGCQSGAVE
ncbi:MAG: histidinol dehydrogenase, partial [Planctomycetaceae bacterium]|nr:histidinol dehydrogenase [Planctomycetaceae bacterium]